jgi:glycosyltransferase involved in cell wall biosynthesis
MTHQGDLGGATNSITWLTRGLAARGHDVTIACRPESLIASRFREGPVERIDLDLPRGLRLLPAALDWKRRIERGGYDVVNAHASLDRHVLSYLRLMGARCALVHTRRNVALSTGGRLRARFDVATTDAIIAVSDRVGEDLVRRGMPAGHVSVVRNGLPLSELRPADPDRVAALRRELDLRDGVPVLGVIARRKSQEELVDAAGRLGRPLEILLAGVDEDDALAQAIARLPDGVRARCLGYRDDVPELSALLDVFVLPSTIEGFSLALLEAMARGLPCVATDAGGNAEALAEGAGILYPPGDVPALTDALRGLLDSPPEAERLARRGRERAITEFDVARTVERTESVYERARSRR